MNKFLNPKLFDKDVEQVPTRNGYGEGVVELGGRSQEIVVLTGGLEREHNEWKNLLKHFQIDLLNVEWRSKT